MSYSISLIREHKSYFSKKIIKDFIYLYNFFMANYYFCGICGSGMSALAQMKRFEDNTVLGSDRIFDTNQSIEIKDKFEKLGVKIYPQNGLYVNKSIDFFVVSSAIEETNLDFLKAKEHKIKILHRSEILSNYVDRYKSIAVSGTSGKTTTTAMVFEVLNEANLSPSVINGGYLNLLIDKGFIGNAYKGTGEILVVEADESDATIKKYHPEYGIILNISKDHKSVDELKQIFSDFAKNCKKVIINENIDLDFNNSIKFGFEKADVKIIENDIFHSRFIAYSKEFYLPFGGMHNIENAISVIELCFELGIDYLDIYNGLSRFKGTFRRFNIIGTTKDNITVIDDYAHNPKKIEAMIKTLNTSNRRIFAIYQPHGFAPTKMFKDELIDVFSLNLKEKDFLLMPEIYYAGGTVNRDISSNDIIEEVRRLGKKALYFQKREDIFSFIKNNTEKNDIIVVMGARDNTLNDFAKKLYNTLSSEDN